LNNFRLNFIYYAKLRRGGVPLVFGLNNHSKQGQPQGIAPTFHPPILPKSNQ